MNRERGSKVRCHSGDWSAVGVKLQTQRNEMEEPSLSQQQEAKPTSQTS